MITKKQTEANKANAKKSTGPKTEEGKVISKMNAVTYGFLAECALMSTEDADEFEALRAMLLKVFKPYGKYEEVLVDQLLDLFWRLRRLLTIEGEILVYARYAIRHDIAKSAKLWALGMDDPLDAAGEAHAAKAKMQQAEDSLGGAFLYDLKNGDSLSKLARHETRIRNEIRKIVADLQKRQETGARPVFTPYDERWNSIDGTPAFPDDYEDGDDTDTEPGTPV